MRRLLVPLGEGTPDAVWVDGEPFHHLVRVLRARVGDDVEIFDGRGRTFSARIAQVEEARAQLLLGPPRPSLGGRWVGLVQGLPKAEKLEWILQKGTELGAAAFLPALTTRAVARPDDARSARKVERWRKIVQEAARQCGRSDVPAVEVPRPLVTAVDGLPPDCHLLVLDEEERQMPVSAAVALAPTSAPLAVVVGPEGGLTREEVGVLVARGAIPVTLGPRVLRTETAALVALALLQHLSGQLG